MEEESSEDTQISEFTHGTYSLGLGLGLGYVGLGFGLGFGLGRTYESNSTRDTITKKISYPFVINTSCPKLKNLEKYVIINKIVEQHNHSLDVSIVEFEDSRKFTDSMIEDIKFMTVSCKFGVTAQRKFLEWKYPTHPLYSQELHNTIQRF
ncbi:unnamed protein product [Rhizophagus irregularis]|nr:unnamed protein product [Rhizophagus irregularis]